MAELMVADQIPNRADVRDRGLDLDRPFLEHNQWGRTEVSSKSRSPADTMVPHATDGSVRRHFGQLPVCTNQSVSANDPRQLEATRLSQRLARVPARNTAMDELPTVGAALDLDRSVEVESAPSFRNIAGDEPQDASRYSVLAPRPAATLPALSAGLRGPLQRKLAVGDVDDPLELDADRVADHVMRMPEPIAAASPGAPVIHRKCACEGSDETCTTCNAEQDEMRQPTNAGVQRSVQCQYNSGNDDQTLIRNNPDVADERAGGVAVRRSGTPIVQRQWSGASAGGAASLETSPPAVGWNKAEVSVAGVRRIPVDGIAVGNIAQDPQPQATREPAGGRAIALLPAATIDTTKPVDVLLHLHGFNVGYRQRSKQGNEATLAPGTVRDVESDRIEQQIAASAQPIIGILPQGTATSDFGRLNSDAYIAAVFAALTAHGAWGKGIAAPTVGRVILSGHSGAGGPISQMMAEPGTPRLPSAIAEVALFDAINPRGPQLGIITNWVLGHLDQDLSALMSLGKSSGSVTSAQGAYLQKSMRFRAYYTQKDYRKPHEKLQEAIIRWFNTKAAPALGEGSPLYMQLYDNYRTVPVHHGQHEEIMGKDNKLLDALRALPSRVQPKVDRNGHPRVGAPRLLEETLRRPGAALDPSSRAFMEARFGHDFSAVRVHADAEAAESADAINARAYTLGDHVVFSRNAYAPASDAGRRLLAHELAHVVQQGYASRRPDRRGVGITARLDVHTGQPVRRQRGVPGLVQRQTPQAQEETAAPIRTGEAGLKSYNFGEFTIFIPTNVLLGARKEITNVKVHVFFAAGGVQGIDANDVLLHGLRGASDQSEWITIGVRGIGDSSNTISDAQIAACLASVGIQARPQAIRLTGHSRGCDSVVATVTQKLIKAPIQHIFLLDEAVEHVDLSSRLPGGEPDPARGSVKYNRVQTLIERGIPAANITSYESTNKSVNLLTGRSAKVGATRTGRPAYIDLDPNCMAAIGEARLVEDAMALDPAVKAAAAKNPKITTLVQNLRLPPRGSFTTGQATGTRKNIQDFCSNPVTRTSIKAIMSDSTLINIINSLILPLTRPEGSRQFRYSTVPKRWGGLAGHEFFVAEIAHELTD